MTGKNNNLIELLTVLCLFLAIGADWNALGGNIMTTHSTILEHFQVTGSNYIDPHVAERAVNQAIDLTRKWEKSGHKVKAKVTVGVMGQNYTVENLRFDGLPSWCRATSKRAEVKPTRKAEKVQQMIADYCDYFLMAKGNPPEAVYLTDQQFLDLGADPGDVLYIGQAGNRTATVTLLRSGGLA